MKLEIRMQRQVRLFLDKMDYMFSRQLSRMNEKEIPDSLNPARSPSSEANEHLFVLTLVGREKQLTKYR